jgi:N-acetylglucosaminyl-diphospho-decaprenol L-rhamnosyltransferase
MKTGALIITWNSAGVLRPCLEAALRYAARVLVVDNASADNTREVAASVPGVEVIANRANRGFAAAANQGFAALDDCGAVLLLNPDAILLAGLDALSAELEANADVAVAAGALVDETSQPQRGFSVRAFPTPAALSFESLGLNRLWPRNPVNRRYRCLDFDYSVAADVEQPAGAFLLIRREAWVQAGGFDEGFHPLWFEDVDFLKRLHASGFRVRYLPAARAFHAGAHSIRQLAWDSRRLYWYGSLLRYTVRHFRLPGAFMVAAAVVLGSAPKAVTGMIQRRSIQPLGVYGQLVRLTMGCLRTGRSKSGTAPVGARCAGDIRSRM